MGELLADVEIVARHLYRVGSRAATAWDQLDDEGRSEWRSEAVTVLAEIAAGPRVDVGRQPVPLPREVTTVADWIRWKRREVETEWARLTGLPVPGADVQVEGQDLVRVSDPSQLSVGDLVLVRARVRQVGQEHGVLVKLSSGSGPLYDAWVRADRVEYQVVADVPEEPEDGVWVRSQAGPGSPVSSVWARADNFSHPPMPPAPVEPDRRWPRRWWDFRARQWVDWPTAYRRGASPTHQLRVDTVDH
jgi:hypothetical protein